MTGTSATKKLMRSVVIEDGWSLKIIITFVKVIFINRIWSSYCKSVVYYRYKIRINVNIKYIHKQDRNGKT